MRNAVTADASFQLQLPVEEVVEQQTAGKFINPGSVDLMKKISDFVDQLRIQHDEEATSSSEIQVPTMRSAIKAPGYEEAQRRSEQVIIQAEKFRADVEKTNRYGSYRTLHCTKFSVVQ